MISIIKHKVRSALSHLQSPASKKSHREQMSFDEIISTIIGASIARAQGSSVSRAQGSSVSRAQGSQLTNADGATFVRPIVFDVGGHRGESVKRFNQLLPHSRIYSFEPVPTNFEQLTQVASAYVNTSVEGCAIGSQRGEAQIYVNAKSDTSSFYKINSQSSWLKRRAAKWGVTPEKFTQKAISVRIETLDDFCQEKAIDHIHLLKIDTQGFETEVLKGAKRLIENQKIDIIECEVMLGNIYEKQVSFSDLESLLLPYGYQFLAIDKSGDLLSRPEFNPNVLLIKKSLLAEFNSKGP